MDLKQSSEQKLKEYSWLFRIFSGHRLRSPMQNAHACPVLTESRISATFLGRVRSGCNSLLALLFLALRQLAFLSSSCARRLSKSTELIKQTLLVECILQLKSNSVLFLNIKFQPLTKSLFRL